jgi:hypothetical protein
MWMILSKKEFLGSQSSDDLMTMISKLLTERIHDKEALVRTHAVTALSRLQVRHIM